MPDPRGLQDSAEAQLDMPLLDFGPLPDDFFDIPQFDQIELPDWMELSWTATPMMSMAGTSRDPHAVMPDEALQMTSASYSSVSHADYPIWFVQTKLLLTLFTVLSGDDELVSTAMSENGFYTLVYESIRQSLQDQATDHRTLSWPEWTQQETRKRTLGGIFIVSTLNMIIYNVNPGFHPTEDLDFEAFDDESHWNARTAGEWRELRTTWHQPEYLTMREMLMDLISDDSSPFHWSVEHAVAAWDCALFVTKWVHAVELDALNDILTSPAEAQLLESMKQVLDETDSGFKEGLSLAAALARLWSLSLQDSNK
ncbi:hypothetical protein Neosp_004259 [[Neocosmospora] mangrovei]